MNTTPNLTFKLVRVVVMVVVVLVVGRALAMKAGIDPAGMVKRAIQGPAVVALESGKEALGKRDAVAAKDYFRQAIDADPKNPESHYYLGVTWIGLRDNQQSVAELSQAIALKPDYFEALVARGSLYGNDAKYDEALADFQQAIAVMPAGTVPKDAYLAHHGVAAASMQKGLMVEGLKAFELALDVYPQNARTVRAVLAQFRQRIEDLGKDSEAYKEYQALQTRIDKIQSKGA